MKCQKCGLVNWGTATACERCGHVLASGAGQAGPAEDAAPADGTSRWSSVSAINREREETQTEVSRQLDLATPRPQGRRGPYTYKMVQIAPSLVVNASQHRGQEAAEYMESIVNEWAAAGWEFYRIDTMSIYVPPGCLGLGGQGTNTHYYVVTFRRQAKESD